MPLSTLCSRLVEAELRRVACLALRGERGNHTRQATALVNEAWLRLEGERRMQWHDRGHFFAVVAQMMRFILAEQRGGDVRRVTLSDALGLADASAARGCWT